jgi:hypothetical protein
MSTDLWREAKVQDWIALCMSSGGLERHRWQEQGVMSFIWLLFTNTEELLQLEPPMFEFVHSRKPQDTEALCVQSKRADNYMQCWYAHVDLGNRRANAHSCPSCCAPHAACTRRCGVVAPFSAAARKQRRAKMRQYRLERARERMRHQQL